MHGQRSWGMRRIHAVSRFCLRKGRRHLRTTGRPPSPNVSRRVGVGERQRLDHRRLGPSAGPPTTQCDAANGRGGSWSKAGLIIFAPNPLSALFRIPETDGRLLRSRRLDGLRRSIVFPIGPPPLNLKRIDIAGSRPDLMRDGYDLSDRRVKPRWHCVFTTAASCACRPEPESTGPTPATAKTAATQPRAFARRAYEKAFASFRTRSPKRACSSG